MGKYNIFDGLKSPRDILGYTLMRGVTDWTQLQQFDMYESGFPYLIVVSVPEFMEKMASADADVDKLLSLYTHIVENEFKGFDSGLENITADTNEINNGKKTFNVITSTTSQGASTFSATYTEKSGSPLTKFHELYLRSIRDPESTFKHYGGLIGNGAGQIAPEDAGFHKECFSFLYIHTDNTGLLVEKAVYIVGAMPMSSEQSIYNGNKGTVEFKDISLEWSGYPVVGSAVNKRAKEILDYINDSSNTTASRVVRNSYDFGYFDTLESNKNSGAKLYSTSSNSIPK